MHVEPFVIDEAARQLRETIGTYVPLDPPFRWRQDDLDALHELFAEVREMDLRDALVKAAERLPEPDDGDDLDDGED
jgi:hypothetical protein